MKLFIDWVCSPDYSWGCQLTLIAHEGNWSPVYCRDYAVAYDSDNAFPPEDWEVDSFIKAVTEEYPGAEIINHIC